jgi:hypothetical protein
MDSFLALSALFNTEKFEDVKPTGSFIKVTTVNRTAEYVSLAIGIVIGLFAAYLSWTCYENITYSSVPARILFAVFAFLFGMLYLIIYALFKTSNCSSRSRHHHSSRR